MIETLKPGDESLLEGFLRPHLETSLFLLNNSRRVGLSDHGQPFEGTYFAAYRPRLEGQETANELAGLIAHYWQGNLILQAPEQLEPILEAVQAAGVRPIRGLLGPAEQVTQAWKLLELREDQIQLDEQEGLYALPLDELLVPRELHDGRLVGRRLEARDLDLATAWRVAYCLEALASEETSELRDGCRADMEASLERGDTWILEDSAVQANGGRVASTSFNAAIREAVQIGGVWTPPELRGRGYGRAAVAASLLEARSEGVERAILFTGDANVPAIKAYAALGFQRIGDHRIVLLRSPV